MIQDAVVYEDEFVRAINKRPGLVCSPENFPGFWLIHRLDKDTSGLLLLAKDETSLKAFQNLFRQRQVTKAYLVLCFGRVLFQSLASKSDPTDVRLEKVSRNQGMIEAAIRRVSRRGKFDISNRGRSSQTAFKVIRYFRYRSLDLSLVKVTPLTGRTHQIRVHFAALGWPLAGDRLYAPGALNRCLPLSRQFLHAASLILRHPFRATVLRLEAALSDELRSFLKILRRCEERQPNEEKF